MKKNSRRSSFPVWQIERANRLHRQFVRVQKTLAGGKSFKKAVQHFLWFWRGKTYKCDPARKCQFSVANLRRLYAQWLKGGQVPAALYLQYKPAAANIPAPVVVAFKDFCVHHPHPNIKTAWQQFSNGPVKWGRGRELRKLCRKFNYAQVCRYFHGSDFKVIQALLKTQETARLDLAKLSFSLTARIRRQLPDRSARKRRTGADLSLNSMEGLL